jgi:beta-lactamase regulating signal transducer with metallopeptidase domain
LIAKALEEKQHEPRMESEMSWHVPVWLWLAHTALGGSVVLLLGCLALRFIPQPALRLRVAELTLLSCLLVPFAGYLPFVPRYSVAWLGSEAASSSLEAETDPDTDSPPSGPPPGPLASPSWQPESPVPASEPTPASSEAVAAPIDPPMLDAPGKPLELPSLSLVAVVAFAVGTALYAGRWLLGLILLARLQRSAGPVPPRVETLFESFAGPAGRRVRLRMSDRISLPLTFGWLRPVILLPAGHCEGDEEGLRYGLAHEWSHAERGDIGRWHLSTLVGLLFYWQPLFWWLRRQLRLDQDFLADALAASQAEEREDYAAYLVSVARSTLDRPLVGSLGIANRSSNLSRRIIMLLNNTPLRRRCPGTWNLALVGAAIAILGLVAAVRLDAGDDAKVKEAAKEAPKEVAKAKGETLKYFGIVTDKDTGKPIKGATVTVRRCLVGDPEVKVSFQIIQETKHKTDAKGRYTFTIPPEQSSKRYMFIDFDVVGPGYAPKHGGGYALSMIQKNEKMGGRPFFEAVTLRPGKEIHGVLETPEGKPAAGVKVMSYSVTTKKSKQRFEFGSSADTKTDANGRFSLTVVTPGDGVYWVLPAKYAPSTHMLKGDRRGDQGKIVLEKGVVMRGKVLDAKGKPLAGVFVHARKDDWEETLNQLPVSYYINRTTPTNDKGEFTFAPLPAGAYKVQARSSGYDPSDDSTRHREKQLPGVFMPQKVVLKEGEKAEPVEVQAVPHVVVEAQYYDSKGKKSRGHSQRVFGQIDKQLWLSDMKADAGGKLRALVPHGLTEVRMSMSSNEHGAHLHRKAKGGPLSRGHELNLGTVEGDIKGIEIVTFKAPILVVKVTTKGPGKAKDTAVTVTYPPEKGLQQRGRYIVPGGHDTDVSFEQQEDGRFRSSQLLPDEALTVTAHADGYAEKTMKMKLAEGTTKEIEIVLEPK